MNCYARTESTEFLLKSGDFSRTYGAIESKTTDATTTDLREVVVKESSKTALELFGKAYTDLEDKLADKSKLVAGFMVPPFLGTFGSIISIFTFLGLGDGMGVLWSTCSMGAFFSSVFIPLTIGEYYKKAAHAFYEGCQTVTAFYNEFEEFKKDPQDFKVASLLTSFSKIYEEKCFSYIHQDDASIFASAGKLLVLDAAVKLIEERNERSQLPETWNKISNAFIENHELHASLWKSLGIEKPVDQGFFDFKQFCKEVKIAEVATKVANSFKEIISYNIANGNI